MPQEFVLGSDTAETCWLCNRRTGELCHVHDPELIRMRGERDAEADELGAMILDGSGATDAGG